MANLNSTSLSTLNSEILASPLDNFSTVGVLITGTWIGTLTFFGSLDGVIFDAIDVKKIGTKKLTSTTTTNGQFLTNVSGLQTIKIKMTSYTSGTADITVNGNSAYSGLTRSITNLIDGNGSDTGITANPIINAVSGGTDSTIIGNTGDKLKVDLASVTGTVSASYSSKVRVDVSFTSINLTTGSFTNIYTYSGTGFLHGFNIEFNNAAVIVRLQIDGETIFTGNSISQLNGLIGTGNDAARRQAGTGIVTSSSTIDWSMKQPIKFNSNITISADANGGVLLSRNFTQGIFYLSKET